MRIIKKSTNLLILFTISISVVFIGCEKEEPNVEIDQETVEMEALSDADFDEIDDLVAVSVLAAEITGQGARTTEDIADERFSCADVTINRESKTIIIDFGAGCEGPRGRIRSGVIRISYSGFWLRPGSKIITTLENFSIDGRQIEGTRTVTNITSNGAPKHQITLSGGKIIFLDGRVVTREVNRIRMWVRADNPLNDEFHILAESSASGVNRNGIEYQVTIEEDLVYKIRCRQVLTYLPVSGVKVITVGDNLIVMDFGDGECDNIITASFNGVIRTIEVSAGSNPNS
jgi:hypothetical protein